MASADAASCTDVDRSLTAAVSLPSCLLGALPAELTGGFAMPKHITGTMRSLWMLRAWSHRPISGVAAAMVLPLSLLSGRMLGTNTLMAAIGTETVLLASTLTGIDDAIVRFMIIAGHRARRIISHHAKEISTFLTMSAPGCWIMLGPVAAGIVAVACAAMLLLLTLRMLAYRLHSRGN